MRLSVVLIARNEEKKIRECLESLQFADEIVVLDSGSHDQTPELARKAGAKVFTRMLDNFAAHRNHAMTLTEGDWILFVDADERISLELRLQIERTIRDPEAADGYTFERVNHLFGGPMLYGACGRDYPLRLVRRGKGKWEGLVHERLVVNGRVGHLRGEMRHVTTQSLDDYFAKFNLYTTLEARERIESGKPAPGWLQILFRPKAEFFYYYILRQGFRDGSRGFIYQVLSSFYVFVKYLKMRELARSGLREVTRQKDLKEPSLK